MKLWNWLIHSLTGLGSPSHPQATVAVATAPPDENVAVLEPPTAFPPIESSQIPTETACWWAPPGVTETIARPVPRVELSAGVRALEEHLVSHFDGHNLTIPPLPRVAENVLKRLRSPKCGMAEVAHDLSEDPVSAASVLRIANSVMYRGIEKITSLPTAVTRLGASAIRTLMMHQSLRSAVFAGHGDAQVLADLIWRGALAAATTMRELARLTRMDPEEAFTIGLLHDIGNVLTLRLVLEHERSHRQAIDTDTFDFLCYETHQEFGELIANAWQLPPELKSLISDHHVYPRDDDLLRKQRLMLILTDMISQMLGYAPAAQYDLLRAEVVRDLGLSDQRAFLDLLAALPDRISATADEFC